MNINVASLSSRTIWCRRRFDGRKGEMVITTHTNARRVLHGTISSHSVAVVAHDFWSCRFLVSCALSHADLLSRMISCHTISRHVRFEVLHEFRSCWFHVTHDFRSCTISSHAHRLHWLIHYISYLHDFWSWSLFVDWNFDNRIFTWNVDEGYLSTNSIRFLVVHDDGSCPQFDFGSNILSPRLGRSVFHRRSRHTRWWR